MPPKPQKQFNENDSVWALDNGRYYHAKILAAEKSGHTWSYFVHFQNWNKKWDRWFEADGLRALDDAEVEAATGTGKRHINGIVADEDAAEAALAAAQTVKDEEQSRKRRRKAWAAQELCDEDAATYSKLPIPFTLKKLLIDEWEVITKGQHRLPQLPRERCVRQILNDFLDTKSKRADQKQLSKYQDLLDGLCLYFDKALPMILLYRQERSQYEAVSREWPDATPSAIYGVEHLLRLFVKIPRLMTLVSLAPTEMNHVHGKFTELLKFLQKNHSTYFVGEYLAEADAFNREIDMTARVAALEQRRREQEQSIVSGNGEASDVEEETTEETAHEPALEIAETPARRQSKKSAQKRRSRA